MINKKETCQNGFLVAQTTVRRHEIKKKQTKDQPKKNHKK